MEFSFYTPQHFFATIPEKDLFHHNPTIIKGDYDYGQVLSAS